MVMYMDSKFGEALYTMVDSDTNISVVLYKVHNQHDPYAVVMRDEDAGELVARRDFKDVELAKECFKKLGGVLV